METNSEAAFADLIKQDVCQADRLAKYIIVKRRWSPLRAAFFASLFVIIFEVLIAFSAKRLLPSPYYRALLVDAYWWIASFINAPVVWFYYIWLYEAPLKVEIELRNNKVLQLDNSRRIKAFQLLSDNRPTYLAVFIGLVLGILFYLNGTISPPVFFNSSGLYSVLHQMVLFPSYFAAAAVVLRLIYNTLFFGRIVEDSELKPLHPDNAGGMLPLGKYALNTLYPIVLIGFVVAILEYWLYTQGEMSTAYVTHGIVILYLVLAPIIFYAPLRVAHKAMKRSRDALVNQISNQFNLDYSRVLKKLDKMSSEFDNDADNIEQLYKIYKITSNMSVSKHPMALPGRCD